MVDLPPKADEVVGRRKDRHHRHPVDRGVGNQPDGDNEAEPVPVVPAMRQNGRDHRHNLKDGFQFTDLGGGDRKAFGGGDRPKAGDKELAADDQDRDPRRNNARVVGDQRDIGGGHQQFVGERIEQHADRGDLLAASRKIAVQAVGDGGCDKHERSGRLLQTGRVDGRVGAEQPDQHGNGRDAGERDGVRKVHQQLVRQSEGTAIVTYRYPFPRGER